MKLNRLAIEFDINGIDYYTKINISRFGSIIENSFFNAGLLEMEFEDLNFIIIGVTNLKKRLPPPFLILKNMIRLTAYMDSDCFFKLPESERLIYLIEIINTSLVSFLKDKKIKGGNILKLHEQIEVDGCITIANFKSKGKLNILLAQSSIFNGEKYFIKIPSKNVVLNFCNEYPIYVVNDNETKNVARFLTHATKGWIQNNIFQIKYAHKEYNFHADKMQIQVIVHEELKEQYANWACIHDGNDVTI